MQERLQKVLAAAGVASRRDAESLITSGKVTVNGQEITELGFKVDPERDHIAVDGKRIPRSVDHIYLVLYKPKGYVTTREDPHATDTVMELVRPALEARLGRANPAVHGLHPVGRLDATTEGLLILSNDGAFTQALTHPSHGVPKLYRAEVRGVPSDDALEKVRQGIPLFGRRTLPARARMVRVDRTRGIATVEVELREGRNQQVRRMFQAVGYPVNKLMRVGVGPVTLRGLKPGQWRFLTPAEVETLMAGGGSAMETEPRPRPARPRTPPRGPRAGGPSRPVPAAGRSPGGGRRGEGPPPREARPDRERGGERRGGQPRGTGDGRRGGPGPGGARENRRGTGGSQPRERGR
jgi:23S rRNA pseudouridine2605 synthase